MYRSNGLVRLAFRVFAAVVGTLVGAEVARAQGNLATSDGLRIGLSATGTVTSLQSSGVEYANSAIKSGLMYREVPASPPNLAPNGSFETGTSVPTSWSWSGGTGGAWSIDTATKLVGTRSLKVAISGSTARRSPTLVSSTFTILPNTSYTLSCDVRTSGLSYPLNIYLVEQGSDGSSKSRNVSSSTGTTNWAEETYTFTSGPLASKAYIQAYIYNGYGTAWLDDVKFTDVFGGRVPVAFGGAVTAGSGTLTQAVSTNGLTLNAKYTAVGTAIRVDATLTDTTGQDRAVEVSFRLPLRTPGWSWEKDLVTSSQILTGVRYENTDYAFSLQGRTRYPFATVRNSAASFSLAVPMGPQMQRFSYDTVSGLRSVWDFGLSAAATKTKSKATWTFWIYTSSPKWGMRAAAQKLYALDPATFTTPLKLQGAWALHGSSTFLSEIPGWRDFGWGLQEGDPIQDIDFDNDNGILTFHYLNPVTWFRQFPGYTVQPPYSTIVSALQYDATSGTGTVVDSIPRKEMAQAIINSSPKDPVGNYQVIGPYFWYSGDLQGYPGSPDSNIPAPSLWSVFKKYTVDNRAAMWAGRGNHLDGIFLDNLTYPYANIENHTRTLWAYSDLPLTFSYKTRQVTLYNGFSEAEFCKAMRAYLGTKGMRLMGSSNSIDMNWLAPNLDVVGGEVKGAEAATTAYHRRALAYGKNWTNLYIATTSPTAAEVLAYFRQALLLGYYPGFNGSYWTNSSLYERDRANFRIYMPLIKKAVLAGWKPIPYATPSDPAIYVERFDDEVGATFYLTAQNSSTSAKTFQMTVDAAALGATSGTITLKELVGNTTLSASRSGSNIFFSDTLAAGETAAYQMTVGSGGTSSAPTPTPPPSTTPPPSATPAPSGTNLVINGGFETGSGSPTGWTLGVGLTSGNWFWDASTFHTGSRSVKLAVAGTTNQISENLTSASFALAKSTTHTLTAWTKSSSIGGIYEPLVWLVETDSAGNPLRDASGDIVRHSVSADAGTTGWVQKTTAFETDSRCVRAYVYALIYKGHGTVWLDDISVK